MSDSQLEIKPIESIADPTGETVLAIVRSRKDIEAADSCPYYIQISIGRHLFAGTIIFGLASIHVFLAQVAIDLGSLAIAGCLFGQSQLLGLWLALSPWSLWKRFPVVVALSGCSAWSIEGDWDFVIVAWTYIGAASLLLSVPRVVFGWRIDFYPEKPCSLPNWRSGGTILGLFGYVLACGFLLAAIQFFAGDFFRTQGNDWIEFLSLLLPMSLLNSVCTVAIMCPTSKAAKAIAIGVTTAFAAVAAVVYQMAASNSSLQLLVFYSLANLPVVGLSLWLLRRLGWRLYQQTPPTKSAESSAISFDSM